MSKILKTLSSKLENAYWHEYKVVAMNEDEKKMIKETKKYLEIIAISASRLKLLEELFSSENKNDN